MECLIGQIQILPIGYAPQDWLPCDGRLLQISQNQTLYSVLGTKFGGNGSTTFAVPDLRPAAIGDYNQYYIATVGFYPERP